MTDQEMEIRDRFIREVATKLGAWAETEFNNLREFGEEDPGDEDVWAFAQLMLESIRMHGVSACWWLHVAHHAKRWGEVEADLHPDDILL